jgi:hypothetical protein
MEDLPLLGVILFIGFDLFWVLTFILIIRRGQLDRAFGMPFVAIVANFAWDFIFGFIYPSIVPQVYFNIIFLLFDLVIFWQLLRYWRREFTGITGPILAAGLGLTTAVIFALYFGIMVEFDDFGGVYVGFVNNFITSSVFIGMLLQRSDLRGQSLYIALCKMLGTGSSALGLYLYPRPGFEGSTLLPLLYVSIFAIDLAYTILVYRKSRALGIDPWRRV